MNDKLEAYKNALCEQKFAQEPLAKAIMFYLLHNKPEIYYEILSTFNLLVSKDVDDLITAELENQSNLPTV